MLVRAEVCVCPGAAPLSAISGLSAASIRTPPTRRKHERPEFARPSRPSKRRCGHRAVAERAGCRRAIGLPFLADRDEILDAHVERAEQAFAGNTLEEVVRLEIEVRVAYYEPHPS